MVERPIKKSERQTAPSTSDVVEEVQETEPSPVEGSQSSITQSSEERSTTRPIRRKDKTDKKGKGNQQESERSGQVNPALVRGPKPTKPKPPVIKEIQQATTEDSDTEPGQETTAEG
jgi:hypothetical protein